MLQGIIDWLYKLFKRKPVKSEKEQAQDENQQLAYESTDGLNITTICANKVSNIVCGDSRLDVNGTGARAEFMRRTMQRVYDKINLITDRALGTGGVVLKPYLVGRDLYIDVLPQSRFFVVEKRGEVPIKAQFVAEVIVRHDGTSIARSAQSEYMRLEYHTLSEDGIYTIETKAMKDGEEVPLQSVEEWADIDEVVTVTGVTQMLYAFVKCPTDNKTEIDDFRGVPLTYGQDELMIMARDILREIPDEYKKKKAFIGVSDLLFNGHDDLPNNGIYHRYKADGSPNDNPFWEIYSPEIRHTAYFAGIEFAFGLIEKAIGVNRGVLTELDTADATATAIKRSTFDTFNLVDAMRRNLEVALQQIAYAFDVYANVAGLAPVGDYELAFDWSYSLLEDSQESFNQLRQVVADGGLGVEHETAFVKNISPEEALEYIPEMQTTDDTVTE